MSGEVTPLNPTQAETIARLSINLGMLNLNYEGPRDFLKDLPALLAALQEFETTVGPPVPPGKPQ